MPLVADSTGRVAGTFLIPPNIPMGSKLVRAQGSGGSNAATRFIGEGIIQHDTVRQVTGLFFGVGDPLAQTFQLPTPRIVTGVDLVFTEIGSNIAKNHVEVQLRDVTAGVPNGTILARGLVQYDEIHVRPVPGQGLGAQTDMGWNFDNYPNHDWGEIYKNDIRVYNSPSWGGPGRAFLKFALPNIPVGALVTSAKLLLNTNNVWGNWQFPVRISKAGITPWSKTNHKWNNWDFPQDMYIHHASDPIKVPVARGGWTEFNVQQIVQSWVNGDSNDGFCLHAETEINTHGGIVEFDNTTNRSQPQLMIEWVKNPVSAAPLDGRWTRITFSEPTFLEDNRSYAMVVLTDDSKHAVGIATLGQKVLPGNGTPGYVTEQPYIAGVLLSSSNTETWTAHQNSDLTFRLVGANFTSGARDVNLGNFTAAQVTDLVVQATVFRPDPTTSCRFKITRLANNEVFYTDENTPLNFSERFNNESFNVVAELRGTATLSPFLFPGTLIATGNLSDSADYVTAAIDAAENFNVTVNMEVATPGSSSVAVFVENHVRVAGVDQYSPNGEPVTEWLTVSPDPLTTPKNLGDGRFERVYKRTGIRGVGNLRTTRVKLIITGGPDKRVFVDSLAVFTKLP